ncbi:MAG: asparagine synthase (glutamine-hydrolyzing) [Flavobacteriales bacterium]|nr:asparagine synthase (glutamine-hydrolyzing) [Flavobacteriales bacterium]
MCGINGIFGVQPGDDGRKTARTMNDALAHRGPDAEGYFVDNEIVLAHRRLSVIDLDDTSNQPITDTSGRYTLVFNGEIYNYRELRKSLGDYRFKSNGDSEVLLAGLATKGEHFLKDCNGMFAFALWDKEKRELKLGRDRMGIKPLYYARNRTQLVFSSEIRPVLKSGLIPVKLNTAALGDYLRYQTVHAPNTIIDGVYGLPAGNIMTVSDNEDELKTYWSPTTDFESGLAQLDYNSAKELVRMKLEKAVRRRLVSDVPFGAFLSGGIDSSALVALASQELSAPLKTFTVSFGDSAFSETPYANMVAEKYATDHTQIDLRPADLIENLPAAIAAMDHPGGDGINTYVVSKAAKHAGITVALSGLGGDEIFAGYPIFKQFYSLRDKGWMMSFPKFARAGAGAVLEMVKPGVASSKTKKVITEDYLDLEYVYQYSREVNSVEENEKLSVYGKHGANSVFSIVKDLVGYGSPGYRLPSLSRVSVAEMSTYLQSVLLRDTDQMSMAHALEVRVPFLDHELVNAVLGISDAHKFPTTPKKLLVDAMGDLLPSEIVNRPKMGFTFPWEKWMKGELRDFCETQIHGLAQRDEFNKSAILSRWEKFLNGDKRITWSRIWYLCILQAWLTENNVD